MVSKIKSIKSKSLKYGLDKSFLFDLNESLLKNNFVVKKNINIFNFLKEKDLLDFKVEEYFLDKNDFFEKEIFNDETFFVEKDKNYFFKVKNNSNFTLNFSNIVNLEDNNSFIVFVLEENVVFNLKTIYFKEEKKEKSTNEKRSDSIVNDDVFKSVIFKFVLKQNSVLNYNQLFVSDEKFFLRNKFYLEENSIVNPNHSLFNYEKGLFDFYSFVVHKGKNSNSDMKVKSININNSKSILQGNVKILDSSFYSNGYQQIDSIILNDAVVIPIPNLEIHNNEVKCSHGSTVTSVDEKFLFYLQSRGITKKDSLLLLLSNFLNSILTLFNNEELEEYSFKIKNLIVLEEKL